MGITRGQEMFIGKQSIQPRWFNWLSDLSFASGDNHCIIRIQDSTKIYFYLLTIRLIDKIEMLYQMITNVIVQVTAPLTLILTVYSRNIKIVPWSIIRHIQPFRLVHNHYISTCWCMSVQCSITCCSGSSHSGRVGRPVSTYPLC